MPTRRNWQYLSSRTNAARNMINRRAQKTDEQIHCHITNVCVSIAQFLESQSQEVRVKRKVQRWLGQRQVCRKVFFLLLLPTFVAQTDILRFKKEIFVYKWWLLVIGEIGIFFVAYW